MTPTGYPSFAVDALTLAGLFIVWAAVRSLRRDVKQPPLDRRVGVLEAKMLVMTRQIELLSGLPDQVLELRTTLNASLMHQQERIDHMEAVVLDESEKTRESFNKQFSKIEYILTKHVEDEMQVINGIVEASTK